MPKFKNSKCDILSNFQTVWWQCGLPKSAIICKMLLWHWRENDEFLRGHICPLLFQTAEIWCLWVLCTVFSMGFSRCVDGHQLKFHMEWVLEGNTICQLSKGNLAVDQKSINSKRWKRVNEDQIKLFLSPVLTAFHNNIFATFHYIMGVP